MTNRELSKQLGISPATLSLVINNKPGISVATRTRVLDQLAALGFSKLVRTAPAPQPAVPGHNICFVVYKRHGDILDRSPFFLLIMESVENCARLHGYNILFIFIDRRNPMEEQMERLRTMDCKSAVIFATEMLDDDISLFHDLPFPYVILDNDFPWANIDSVAINNTLGTFQAVEHLVQAGHRKIGYLKSKVRIRSFDERTAGFTQALAHFGLTLPPHLQFELDYSEEGSYQDFKRYLADGAELPTAFVTDDDTIAAGVIKVLTEASISVPDDISVVGFNDRPLCEISSPPLTSIRVPKYAFGSMAIELLVKRLENTEIQRDAIRSFKYRIGTEVVRRQSVKKRFG